MKMENQTCRIKPADRLASVSEYYFSKKLKEVAQMNAEGMDVISLGIGSPDMPPSEKTIRTLCEAACNPDGHGYMPYVGIPELRRGFADWYQKWYGVALNPNTEIQPLIGSKEGILHVTLAFVNPGEQVLVPNPGYPTYTSLSNTGTVPETGGLRTPQGHRHRKRQPLQFHPERTSYQHPQHSGCQRVLHRIQFHEQKPQHAGLAYRHACLECRLRAMDIESKKQYRQRYVPCHATGSRHCPGSRARLV